jgi:hypothetical protein
VPVEHQTGGEPPAGAAGGTPAEHGQAAREPAGGTEHREEKHCLVLARALASPDGGSLARTVEEAHPGARPESIASELDEELASPLLGLSHGLRAISDP